MDLQHLSLGPLLQRLVSKLRLQPFLDTRWHSHLALQNKGRGLRVAECDGSHLQTRHGEHLLQSLPKDFVQVSGTVRCLRNGKEGRQRPVPASHPLVDAGIANRHGGMVGQGLQQAHVIRVESPCVVGNQYQRANQLLTR